MVEPYKPKHFLSLLEFIKNNPDNDFYVTENNARIIIKDEVSLKKLLKQICYNTIIEDRGDIVGILVLWKSVGVQTRYYVKLNAINDDIANRLITVLVWNSKNELFAKLKKNSRFLSVFREKGFEFLGDRGSEVLLKNNYKSRKADEYNNNESQVSNRR